MKNGNKNHSIQNKIIKIENDNTSETLNPSLYQPLQPKHKEMEFTPSFSNLDIISYTPKKVLNPKIKDVFIRESFEINYTG